MKKVKGFMVKATCVGYGKTKNEALEKLLADMNDSAHNIEFGDGENSLVYRETEIEED